MKGVSSWLTVAPSAHPAFVLNKSDFRDAVCIRYGLPLVDVATTCVCGKDMDTAHALTCPAGGYPSARHDELKELLGGVMAEVLPDVQLEPVLLPYDGESIGGRTANRAEDARLDIRARGFWSRQQDAFFDVRVTHPKATLLSGSEVLGQLKSHEAQKKRQYSGRVIDVERGTFTPLVFGTNGMAAPEASRALKELVRHIVGRDSHLRYSSVMGYLRTRISFCLLRWAVTCFRGCRASYLRRGGRRFLADCRQLP